MMYHDNNYDNDSKYSDMQASANSVDRDQTALWSSLIRVCTVCLTVSNFYACPDGKLIFLNTKDN